MHVFDLGKRTLAAAILAAGLCARPPAASASKCLRELLGISFCPTWTDDPPIALQANVESCDRPGVRALDRLQMLRVVSAATRMWLQTGAYIFADVFGTTTSTSTGEPIPVFCATDDEEPALVGDPGMASYDIDLGLFSGLYMAGCRIVVNPFGTEQDGIPIPHALTLDDFRRYGTPFFIDTIAHELGHCFGLGHDDTDPTHLMSDGGANRHITEDEELGLVGTLDYGWAHDPVLTSRATYVDVSTLSFSAPHDSGFRAVGRPAAAGNTVPDGRFDYVVVRRVTGDDLVVELLAEKSPPDGEVEAVAPTRFVQSGGDRVVSPEDPAVAVGVLDGIGVAYVGPGRERLLHFAVSYDLGVSWTVTNLGYTLVGAPTVAYNGFKNRWVVAWIHHGTLDDKYKIATMVSSSFDGGIWDEGGWYYDDDLTMHHGTPAIACPQGSPRCLLAYSRIPRSGDASLDIGAIHQRAFQLSADGGALDSVTTFGPVGIASPGNPALVSFELGYLLAVPNLASLEYRLKATDVGPWPAPIGRNSEMNARHGVSVAFNRRTGDFRFFWTETPLI